MDTVVVERNPSLLAMEDNWNKAVSLVPPDAAYFRVLCADDLMSPEFAEKTVAVAERNPAVVAVGCQLRHRGLDWAADLLPSAPSAASFLASQPLEVSP